MRAKDERSEMRTQSTYVNMRILRLCASSFMAAFDNTL